MLQYNASAFYLWPNHKRFCTRNKFLPIVGASQMSGRIENDMTKLLASLERECRFDCTSGLNRIAGGAELSQLWDNCYQCAIRPAAAASPAQQQFCQIDKNMKAALTLGQLGPAVLRPRQWQIFTFMHNVFYSEYNSLASPFLYKQHHATSIFCQNVEDDWTVLLFYSNIFHFMMII